MGDSVTVRMNDLVVKLGLLMSRLIGLIGVVCDATVGICTMDLGYWA